MDLDNKKHKIHRSYSTVRQGYIPCKKKEILILNIYVQISIKIEQTIREKRKATH